MTMAFPDMAPYLVRNSATDQVEGAIAQRVTELAAQAGLEVRWVGPLPRARIWAGMAAQRPICHPNARRTADRAERFKMTAPVFNSPDYRIIVRRDMPHPDHATLAAWLADETLIFGRLLGRSLGPELDRLVERHKGRVASVRTSSLDLVKMLVAGRIDFTVMDVNELAKLLSIVGAEFEDFDAIPLPDLPHAEAGRIMCAASVPDTVISAFDAAIQSLPFEPDMSR